MPRNDVIAPVVRVLKAPELRRVHLAFLTFSISEHATWLAILFYALQRGGPKEVGIVAVVQLLPGVVCTPFSSYAGDRFDPRRALAAGYAVQSLAMAGTAAAMWAGSAAWAYGLATVVATAIGFTRPVMGALLPTVTHSPADLVAANVVAGLIEQIGVLVGPIGAGVLMASTSPAEVFAVSAGCTAVGSVVALAVHAPADRFVGTPPDARAAVRELFEGFRAVRRSSVMRVFLMFIACGALVKGIGDVIFVTYADIRLDGTASQAGILAGAYGVGGLIGATTVTGLVHGRRVERQLAVVAVALMGSLVVLATSSVLGAAVVGFAMLGGSESALALTSTVSVQRVAPPEVLARVFGIVEATQTACMAAGSLGIAVLVAAWSLGSALVALAVVLGAIVLLGVVLLAREDAVPPVDAGIVDRLLRDPLFESLPAPIIERLARGASAFTVPDGAVVVSQGSVGDRYYLVVDGELIVTKDGAPVATLDDTRSFGELALLGDAPRAASVTARTDATLLAVQREPFLEAITGHSRSLAAARHMASSYD